MTRLTTVTSYLDGLSGAVAASLAAPGAGDEAAGRIHDWLGRLMLLHGVPFQYLVPDARMLPPESLRLFRVDRTWLAALVDGAYSIGRATAAQAGKETDLLASAMDAARSVAATVRPGLTGAAPPTPDPDGGGGPITGFLLRSGAVAAWPAMEVKGFADAARQTPLPALRLERLTDGILLGLFDGVLAALTFAEPAEGLRFGVDLPDPPAAAAGATVALKRVADGGAAGPPGSAIDKAAATVAFRDAGRRVLDAAGTARAVRTALMAAGALSADAAFTPAEFALEMIRGVQSAVVDIT